MAEIDLSDYEDVAARRIRFFEAFPEGSIVATEPQYPERPNGEYVVRVGAYAYRDRDDPNPGTAWSEEPYPGRTPYTLHSEAENAETSAIGRAILCVLPPLPERGGASASEVRARHESSGPRPATAKAKGYLVRLAQDAGYDLTGLARMAADRYAHEATFADETGAKKYLATLNGDQVSELIESLGGGSK